MPTNDMPAAPLDASAGQLRVAAPPSREEKPYVVELFAGVGGFHLGLAETGWQVVWANQWEPSTTKRQHAFEVYEAQFGRTPLDEYSNKDIAKAVASGHIPDHDLLVGGFPCQDYSVAKPLPQATGIRGKKGVLWWQIYGILRMRQPKMVLLENVDRLLNSPSTERGRDFAIILTCLDALGYSVEWRVINAADYGFPQRRRRVFIYAQRYASFDPENAWNRLAKHGVFAKALPVEEITASKRAKEGFRIRPEGALPPREDPVFDTKLNDEWVYDISGRLKLSAKHSPFLSSGVMHGGVVWSAAVKADEAACKNRTHDGRLEKQVLDDIVRGTEVVPEQFLVPAVHHADWERLKGAKKEPRTKGYSYSEGGMRCPDDRERASRTIVTGEGGRTPSRFKHIVRIDEENDGLREIVLEDGKHVPARTYLEEHRTELAHRKTGEIWRRLIPFELEALNGFPPDWTGIELNGNGPLSESRRAFLMGNALVVGLVGVIGEEILRRWRER